MWLWFHVNFIEKFEIDVMKIQVNITQPYDTKTLPEAVLTNISDAMWRH